MSGNEIQERTDWFAKLSHAVEANYEVSSEELFHWLIDKVEEYAEYHDGLTYDICIESVKGLLLLLYNEEKKSHAEEESKIWPWPASSGIVYILHAETTSYIKIGCTTDLTSTGRLRSLQTGSPFSLRLLREIQAADVFGLERRLQHRYLAFHRHGEWFDLPLDILQALLAEDFTDELHDETEP